MKVLTVLGARPQFIKASVVSRQMHQDPDITEVMVHTGQHFDDNMSKVFFDQLQIKPPAYNLDISQCSHGAMTGRMLERVEEVLTHEKPDWVLVYGDTNSTLAGALAASKMHLPVAHVEAGLRSFNMKMPEEINRILTDRISSLLCCPTETAIHNLLREGYEHLDCQVVLTGDVMKDVAMHYSSMALRPSFALPGAYFLVTLHRAENTDDPRPLGAIMAALGQLQEISPIVLPMHPRTAQRIRMMNIQVPQGVQVVDPVGLLEMIYLIRHSRLIMTDSGGLQKEAFFHGKPCVTLREETEWTELVSHGFNVVAGTDTLAILDAVTLQLNRDLDYAMPLYGDGNAAGKIKELLKSPRL